MSLRKAAQFEQVLKNGRRVQGRWLGVSWVESEGDWPRLGLIVGKRWAKLAVERNTVKRILREIFRSQSTAMQGLAIVFRLRQRWETAARRELAQEARALLRRIRE